MPIIPAPTIEFIKLADAPPMPDFLLGDDRFEVAVVAVVAVLAVVVVVCSLLVLIFLEVVAAVVPPPWTPPLDERSNVTSTTICSGLSRPYVFVRLPRIGGRIRPRQR